jgi:hypothetical protein
MAEGFWVEAVEVLMDGLRPQEEAEERIEARLGEANRSLRCGEVVGRLAS